MSELFLGKGIKFPFSINTKNELALVSNEDDIKEAIKIILNTSPGERVMRPDFGCGINNYVFSVVNTSNLISIENEIKRALVLYEPRILVEEVEISTQDINLGYLSITINYLVKSSNSRQNIVYPFYLKEKG